MRSRLRARFRGFVTRIFCHRVPTNAPASFPGSFFFPPEGLFSIAFGGKKRAPGNEVAKAPAIRRLGVGRLYHCTYIEAKTLSISTYTLPSASRWEIQSRTEILETLHLAPFTMLLQIRGSANFEKGAGAIKNMEVFPGFCQQ